MARYKNLSGKSGIVAYEITNDAMTLRFHDGSLYLYTATSAGSDNMEEMKKLAKKGKGLCTFVSQTVKDRFARKIS